MTCSGTQSLSYCSTGSLNAWLYSGSTPFSTDGVNNNGVSIRYTGNPATGDAGLLLTQIYTLVGSQPGSGSSDINEQFQLSNTGSAAVDLHLFQYNNLQLDAGADTLVYQSPSQVSQTSGPESAELVATGLTACETGDPSTVWAAVTSNTLTDNTNQVSGNPPASALEWDVPLAAGKSSTLSEDYALNVVPEPSTLSLVAAMAVCAALAYLGQPSLARN